MIGNKKIYCFIILAFIIGIIVGIGIYYFYNSYNSIKIIQSPSLNTSQNINSSINQNSPFPSSINGFKRILTQSNKSHVPENYSVNLINSSVTLFKNPENNETLAIYQMIYSNTISSSNIFKKIISVIPVSSQYLPNIIILKNLPANYYGISSISSNKTVYSLIAQNNSKICSVSFDSKTHTSNTIINLLENTTELCFKV